MEEEQKPQGLLHLEDQPDNLVVQVVVVPERILQEDLPLLPDKEMLVKLTHPDRLLHLVVVEEEQVVLEEVQELVKMVVMVPLLQ